MHIMQILPALDEGGVERGVVELSRELVRQGNTSTVISHGGRLVPLLEQYGSRHLRLNVKSKNPLTALYRTTRLRHAIESVRPDLVHFRSRVPGWLFTWANKGLGLPFVTTVHGFNSVSRYSAIMTTGLRVICPSQSIADHIRRHYRTQPSKVRVIPRGLDPELFDPAKLDMDFVDQFQRCHKLRKHFVMLALGRITAWKGYGELIAAVALAARELPPFKLLVVGGVQKGQERYARSLHEQVAKLGLAQHVVFTGSQSRIPEIIHCANVVVSNTTTKPETFGRSMVEALAMERPVIASAQGGALDIIRDGVNGWLIKPGDIEALAARLLDATGTSFTGLRDDVEQRFSLKLMVERTIAVYREALEERA